MYVIKAEPDSTKKVGDAVGPRQYLAGIGKYREEHNFGPLNDLLEKIRSFVDRILLFITPDALRRFASAGARYALGATNVHDETLDNAAAHAETLGANTADETDQLRRSVERRVERLDIAAFDAHDALDAGIGPQERYDRAFAQARAATAALRALDPAPLVAAVEACYEAFHATEDADALVAIAWRTLQ